MDEDYDFLSELGITEKKPILSSNNGNGKTQPTPSMSASYTQATPKPIGGRTGAGSAAAPVYLDTDLSKKKKKAVIPKNQSSDHQEDWLSVSPRTKEAAMQLRKNKESMPIALEEDDTVFEPLNPSERFEQFANAFQVDEADFAQALAEELPFIEIAKQNMKDEKTAIRFVAAWRRQCGENIADAKLTPRCVSFLSALVLYHDPRLWSYLFAKHFDYITPSLFEFYAPTDVSLKPVFELWDASIMNNFPGFETPTQGSLMYALGLLICNRDVIMSEAGDVRAVIDGLRVTTDPVAAIVVGARAAKHTSGYFVRLLGEPELNWDEYDRFLAGENKRSPASPSFGSSQAAPLKRQDSNQTKTSDSDANVNSTANKPSATPAPTTTTTAAASLSSWMGSLVNRQSAAAAPAITTANIKESFNVLSQKMSNALQGAIDEEDDAAAARRHQVRRRVSSAESRHLFLIEYPGVRKLGLQLGQTGAGLTVQGFDRSVKGEAETEGTVQPGDVVHSVNWVSVACLPAVYAGKTIAKQERPLHIVFSTANPHGRKLPAGLSVEARAMQHCLLKARLFSYYSRFGQSKVDEVSSILRLYSKHEKALVRGLYHKYGEPVPGDSSFASEVVLISAAEALKGGLARPADDDADPDDLIFVDVRTKEERADTGVLPSTFSLTFDDRDEKTLNSIQKSVKAKGNRTRICLLASGAHRMFGLVDAARAADEKGKDKQRLLLAASKLAAAGMNGICAISGGFTECFREAANSATPFTPELLSDCSQGLLYRACEAYSGVNLKDTESLGQFIVGFFTDFKEPVHVQQPTLLPTGGGSSRTLLPAAPGVGNGLSRNVSQDFQSAFTNFQLPAALPSLSTVAVPSLFKQGSMNFRSETPPKTSDNAKPVTTTSVQQATTKDAVVFSIDDDE